MKRPFLVVNTHGPAWDDERPVEEQADWPGHAMFMNALVDEGFVVLGGTLEGSRDAVLVVQAEGADAIRERLAPDPWMRSGLLQTKGCWPWRVRLGELPGASRARP